MLLNLPERFNNILRYAVVFHQEKVCFLRCPENIFYNAGIAGSVVVSSRPRTELQVDDWNTVIHSF